MKPSKGFVSPHHNMLSSRMRSASALLRLRTWSKSINHYMYGTNIRQLNPHPGHNQADTLLFAACLRRHITRGPTTDSISSLHHRVFPAWKPPFHIVKRAALLSIAAFHQIRHPFYYLHSILRSTYIGCLNLQSYSVQNPKGRPHS